ncbi:MAG: lipoprotein NlpD [Candidatus Azotimanducaceae bacterium]
MLFKFDCKRFGGVVLIALLALLMSGCQSDGAPAPVANIGERGKTHSVQKGDTLYSIAWRYGLDHGQLAKINRIRKPYTIYAGQRLKLAGVPARLSSKSKGASTKQTPKASTGPKTVYTAKPVSKPKPAFTASQLAWDWPVSGKVISKFSLSGSVNKGIDIQAKAGTKVAAAEAGSVVYAGGNLRGYGKLVIIKHDDAFLSAYGNNESLLVKEGETVAKGQAIAKVGANDSKVEMLHFEIRRQGRPEDPVRHLPKR